jgi:hypothetical protein
MPVPYVPASAALSCGGKFPHTQPDPSDGIEPVGSVTTHFGNLGTKVFIQAKPLKYNLSDK